MRIKYDKKTWKKILLLTVLSGLFFGFGYFLGNQKDLDFGILFMILLYLGGGSFLYCFGSLIGALCYFHRLK